MNKMAEPGKMYMEVNNYGILFYKYPKPQKRHYCEYCGSMLHPGYSYIINILEKQNLLVEGITHYCCECDILLKYINKAGSDIHVR